MKKKTLGDQFDVMDLARKPRLEFVRDMALLCCPSVAPEENRTSNDELKNPWQSLGNLGTENLTGRMLLSLFPPGSAWYRLMPSARVRSDRAIQPEVYNTILTWLTARELIVSDQMELTNYRVVNRSTIEDLLVAGASLTHLNDDYSLRRFRYDQWVAKRGSDGQLLWYMTREKKDVAELNDAQRQAAKVTDKELNEDNDEARIKKLYTKIEWQRESKRWLIRQEINEKIVSESDDPVCPYIPAGYRETAGENYPRSFMDERISDLRSFNQLRKYTLDTADIISYVLPVADVSKGNVPADFMRKSGQPIAGRVSNGMVDGMALFESNKQRDLAAIDAVANGIKEDLGRSMLMLTEAMPTGDRVTAQAVRGVARELEGAMGGVYSHMAEQLQRPFLQRMIWQMERDRLLDKLPETLAGIQTVSIITGVAALSKQQELDNLIAAIQVLSVMPGILETLNLSAVADRILGGYMVDAKGLVLTPQQIAARMQQQQTQALEGMAGQQAVATIGKLIENRSAA